MNSDVLQNPEEQDAARSIFYGLTSWAVIAATIFFSMQAPLWFYPLAVLIIANRQLALSFLAHEGLHGNLSAHPGGNDFLARYICAFPLFISLSRYRQLHLMHHRFLGTNSDPDVQFYNFYPKKPAGLLGTFLAPWLAGGTALFYINYFNDVFRFLRNQFMALVKPNDLKWRLPKEFQRYDDRWRFIFFWIFLLAIFFLTKTILLFALFWLVPLYCYIFYFRFTGGLQHGVIFSSEESTARSRNITGNGFLMEILLPCNINYHAEHHQNPRVPFFRLKKIFLANSAAAESYSGAVRSLTREKKR